MNDPNASLPSFASPPIVEVALAVQFEPISQLHAAHMGLLWEKFRAELPQTEDHPPLPLTLEEFGAPHLIDLGIQIEFTGIPPVPRCWFLNASGTELIQVQQD